MNFYKIHPEVPGGIGRNMAYDDLYNITQLDVVFEGWMGNDLMKISAAYLVTDRLKKLLESSTLTGIASFSGFTFELSLTFKNLYPGKQMPPMYWMQLNGIPGVSDLAMGERNKLIVSENALKLLQNINLSLADIKTI